MERSDQMKLSEAEIKFTQRKLCAATLASLEYNTMKEVTGFYKESLMVSLTGLVYEASLPEQKVIHTVARPTFIEWLFRKERDVILTVKVSGLLLEPPPQSPPTIRIMTIEAKKALDETQKRKE